MTTILALDQSEKCTGYAIYSRDVIIEVGSIVTPNKIKDQPEYALLYQRDAIRQAISALKQCTVNDDIYIAIEGVYFAKEKNGVETLIVLSELRGMIRAVCADMAIPLLIIPVPKIPEYIHLSPFAPRLQKKMRTIACAAMLLYDMKTLPTVASGLDAALRHLSDWQPNADGQPKGAETALKHAAKHLPDGMTLDIADAVIIAMIARGLIREEGFGS